MGATNPWDSGVYYCAKYENGSAVLDSIVWPAGLNPNPIPAGYRLPTENEFRRLIECMKEEEWSWVSPGNPVKYTTWGGYALWWDAKNDTCDYFFPATGQIWPGQTVVKGVTRGEDAGYWSSTANTNTHNPFYFYFKGKDKSSLWIYSFGGQIRTARLVYEKK